MERNENRFLIYDQFPIDAPIIFEELMDLFTLKIINVSKYGIHLGNDYCQLDITNEPNGVQIWLTTPNYINGEMFPILVREKGVEIYNEFSKIVQKKCSKEMMIELINFIIIHFSNELISTIK